MFGGGGRRLVWGGEGAFVKAANASRAASRVSAEARARAWAQAPAWGAALVEV